MAEMPASEVAIDTGLVRALLADQHPDLLDEADRSLTRVGFGWDNEMWRLGSGLAVRLPRRTLAAPLIALEQRWLPLLAPRLPGAVPAPVRVGGPSPHLGYPWTWSVVPWFEGAAALDQAIVASVETAVRLGATLAALHQPAPPDLGPSPAQRGAALVERDAVLRSRLDALTQLPGAAIAAAWDRALASAAWTDPPVIVHGDLHPANMVVDDAGGLVAVIDWGDIAAGDPAVDLSVAWMTLPAVHRPVFRAAAGEHRAIDDDTWNRARGNALAHAVAVLAHSDDNPRMLAMGRHTLDQILTDPN